ncbi:26S proteasome regulatory complex, subunit PSMD10 [Handroanthus impetiginosus]|uniref:26S proteasome regulatory complex, subunit PSMD10 n=1 Tax=Handroanthus impetiginosus TaxID=429701 RepID=A0A2G9G7K1_9LAMI|nr:26S proteasome regulatory complex, subunit PSMD10 [Handroanthus impetiginosus]
MKNFKLIVQENAGILDQRSDESLDTALHIATRYGHIEFVAEILRLSPFMAGADNKRGETPLHEACRIGHDKILMMLLETNPWVASKVNCQGQSALYLACCGGHLKVASIFLNQPWLQELDDGESGTFLHVAASEGRIAIVKKILETHPNMAQKLDKNGYSPLHHACSRGHPEITAILLRHDPEQAFRFNRTGYAPVHLAAINGSSKVLGELLSAAPPCIKLVSTKGETVFHLTVKFDRFDAFLYLAQVLKNTSLFNQLDKNGDTCLHLAISGGRHQIAEYIIKEGGAGRAQINYQNFRGDTAMDLLEQAENTSSRQKLKDILEAAGAKRNSELSENVSSSDFELLSFEEPSDKDNDYIDLKIRSSSKRSTQANSDSPDEVRSQSRREVANPVERILRFGEQSDQKISSQKRKNHRNRMRQYKHQSDKSRKNLIELYRKQHKRHEIYREALHNARETITLVGILIATITYTGGINPPGGVFQDGPLRGTAVAARRTSFKVFSVCNNVALFASLCIVIVLVSILPFRRKPLMMMLMVAHKTMWVAVGFMAAAYCAASVVLMPPPHGRQMDWTAVSLLSISAGTLGHHLKKLRYRKKITDATVYGENDKDHAYPEAEKDSFEDYGQSINSDMNISLMSGYHTY